MSTSRAIELTESEFQTYAAWLAEQQCFASHDDDAEERAQWLVVPFTFCPNVATLLDESNQAALVAILEAADPEGETYELQRFNHRATPYARFIVAPGSAAHRASAEAICALADYPALDDSDHSEREYNQQHTDIADGLSSLTIVDADGVTGLDLDAPPADCTHEERQAYLCHQIWEHMWNDGQPWRCLEETGQPGGVGVDQDDVERALTEMGYTYNEDEMEWVEPASAPADKDVVPEGATRIEGCDACGADVCSFTLEPSINPRERDTYSRNSCFTFHFGAYGDTHVSVWAQADHLEDALEIAAEWLADHAPGHLMPMYGEEHMSLIHDVCAEHGIMPDQIAALEENDPERFHALCDEASEDLTYTESGFLTSYEWSVDESDNAPGPKSRR